MTYKFKNNGCGKKLIYKKLKRLKNKRWLWIVNNIKTSKRKSVILKHNIVKDKNISNMWLFQIVNWENRSYKKLLNTWIEKT